jgi:hypothetical protein
MEQIERPNTVAGLMDKRAELVARIKFYKAELRKMTCDLDHLDATIKLFDPARDLTLTAIKRYPTRHRAVKGQMRRFVLGQLRTAQAPITSAQITDAWIKERGLKADEETFVLIRKRVGACLTSLRAAGTITATPLAGEYKGWRIQT